LGTFVYLIFFLVLAVSAVKWPIIEGAFVFALGGREFVTNMTYIVKNVMDGTPIDGFSYILALNIIALISLFCGLMIMLIGFKERKTKALYPQEHAEV